MVRRLNGRLPWLVACAALLALAMALPAAAQSTGMVRGVVKDAHGQAGRRRESQHRRRRRNRHFDTKSDKKGEFVQIGLPPGRTRSRPKKDKVMSNAVEHHRADQPPAAKVTLVLGRRGGRPAAAGRWPRRTPS